MSAKSIWSIELDSIDLEWHGTSTSGSKPSKVKIIGRGRLALSNICSLCIIEFRRHFCSNVSSGQGSCPGNTITVA